MFRTEFTAKIGYTRLLDRTCPECGGLYSSTEQSVCPKCKSELTTPTHNTDDGHKPYCLTEVTLYPLLSKEAKERHTHRTKAAGGRLYKIRMIMWGRFNAETHTLSPDTRTRYMVPKRTIRVMFNDPPTIPSEFNNRQGESMLEMKFVFNSMAGDQLEFLDSKQEDESLVSATAPKPAQTTQQTQMNHESLQQILNILQSLNQGASATAPQQNAVNSQEPEAPRREVIIDDDIPF